MDERYQHPWEFVRLNECGSRLSCGNAAVTALHAGYTMAEAQFVALRSLAQKDPP